MKQRPQILNTKYVVETMVGIGGDEDRDAIKCISEMVMEFNAEGRVLGGTERDCANEERWGVAGRGGEAR